MAAPAKTIQRERRPLRWIIVGVYAALLLASHVTRAARSDSYDAGGVKTLTVRAVAGERLLDRAVRLAYQEVRPDGPAPTFLLLHGSPGRSTDFAALAPALGKSYRLIIPDLPGFGASTQDIPDYSVCAHARYVLQLLDGLGVERAHVLGFSMGGGVALDLADLAPDRVASITMLSAIGVQEMELLGDYHLNHAIHGLQLAGLWLLGEATPHFGWLDDAIFGVPYARNFYDTDQRPLRDILTRLAAPLSIIHGSGDMLVPVEAAREHHRLAPQSELTLLDENHFMVFTDAPKLAPPIMDFVGRVERGAAKTRATADPERIARAALPYNPADAPQATGPAALVLMLLIILATLVSEDLTSISVGVMVAQGRVGYAFGAFACFLGIFVGDVLLFLAGRYLGRPALKRGPLSWFIREDAVERSSQWFTRQGIAVIVASRFVPGMRLPTYFAAGLLHTSFWWFALYFFLAGAVWTPLLVGLSAQLGGEVIRSTLFANQSLLVQVLIAGAIVYFVVKLLISLATWRGRRLLVSKWRRLTRWEFWPMCAFYPPVLLYVAYLMLKHRSLSVFTSVNPAIFASGFIGESKAQILRGLAGANGYISQTELIPAALETDSRIEQARRFMAANCLDFPIVLKPDAGQRGSGVAVVRSENEMRDYLKRTAVDTIIQEHVAGAEFGVFYYRHPEQEKGRIFAITEKQMPVVVGDGRSTLERLILADERAVCMARFYLNKQGDRLWQVPAEGERVQLVELGTHCRGAIFLDGGWVKTDALEEAIDCITRNFAGFYFGRYDIRTPSVEEFQRGENFKVIELNGVTSEATNIYDPRNSLWKAYKVIFEQWRLAFEIGARNRARGIKPIPIGTLAKLLIEYHRRSRSHPE